MALRGRAGWELMDYGKWNRREGKYLIRAIGCHRGCEDYGSLDAELDESSRGNACGVKRAVQLLPVNPLSSHHSSCYNSHSHSKVARSLPL